MPLVVAHTANAPPARARRDGERGRVGGWFGKAGLSTPVRRATAAAGRADGGMRRLRGGWPFVARSA